MYSSYMCQELSSFCRSSTNIKDVINKLDSLEISAADKVPMKILFDTGLDNLGHICDVYARFCFQRYAHQRFVLSKI